MAAPPIFCRLGDRLSQTDGGHGADSIKLSASSHRAIFWNPSTQKKKKCATAAPARDADGAQRQQQDETRRGEARRATVQTQARQGKVGCQPNCRPVDCAAAYLRDSRADPATLCAAKHYTRLHGLARLDHCLARRRAGLHHPVTPVLRSRSVSDCCTGTWTHEAVARDCSQHYPCRYQQYRRAKRPRSRARCRSNVRPATGAPSRR